MITLRIGTLYEATGRFLAYAIVDNKVADEWIEEGTRLDVARDRHNWPPHTQDLWFYEIRANGKRYEVSEHEIGGKVRELPLFPNPSQQPHRFF